MIDRIDALIAEAKTLPPYIYDSTNLFRNIGPTKEVTEDFFVVLREAYVKSEEIRRRVHEADMSGTAGEVYRRINDAGHPVRDGLILVNHNLLEEENE